MGRTIRISSNHLVFPKVKTDSWELLAAMGGEGSETVCADFTSVPPPSTFVELVQVPRNSLRTGCESWELGCVAVAVSGSVGQAKYI